MTIKGKNKTSKIIPGTAPKKKEAPPLAAGNSESTPAPKPKGSTTYSSGGYTVKTKGASGTTSHKITPLGGGKFSSTPSHLANGGPKPFKTTVKGAKAGGGYVPPKNPVSKAPPAPAQPKSSKRRKEKTSS